MQQVIEGTAKLHGCNASVVWSDIAYGPTVNAAPLVSLVEAAAGQLGVTTAGQPRWQRLAEPTMGAEDFSFLAGATWLPYTRMHGLGWRHGDPVCLCLVQYRGPWQWTYIVASIVPLQVPSVSAAHGFTLALLRRRRSRRVFLPGHP